MNKKKIVKKTPKKKKIEFDFSTFLLKNVELNAIKKNLLAMPFNDDYLAFMKKEFSRMIEDWTDHERLMILTRLQVINKNYDFIIKFLESKALQKVLRKGLKNGYGA